MKINAKCYANLSTDDGCNFREPTAYDIPDQTPVKKMLSHIETADAEVHTIFVNGRKAGLDDTLSEGDRIGLFPAVGGM
jgi:hypothetical protein